MGVWFVGNGRNDEQGGHVRSSHGKYTDFQKFISKTRKKRSKLPVKNICQE